MSHLEKDPYVKEGHCLATKFKRAVTCNVNVTLHLMTLLNVYVDRIWERNEPFREAFSQEADMTRASTLLLDTTEKLIQDKLKLLEHQRRL